MGRAQIVLNYLQVLEWPVLVWWAPYHFRKPIRTFLSNSKLLKLTISGLTIEPTIGEIEHSISENLRNGKMTDEQWKWLEELRNGRVEFASGPTQAELDELRPLRNVGLIKSYPRDRFLEHANAVEITTLGRLLAEKRIATA